MILPAVRERLERLLRLPSLEGTLAELRSNTNLVALSGLQDVAKALVAAHLSHELRRPAFFITDSNRRAESLADSLRFSFQIFQSRSLDGIHSTMACCSQHQQFTKSSGIRKASCFRAGMRGLPFHQCFF